MRQFNMNPEGDTWFNLGRSNLGYSVVGMLVRVDISTYEVDIGRYEADRSKLGG
ncbi:MAG: hypothetical protein UY59_C0015G0012 [Candidatus Kaiserbacteria bacterium GW2011_GWA1_50_28]|uniref:Uncharacterized protein n=1 Tax=Candidatus Kaiserbacteria bacterium GW2011_GWA1_50_28 TaxID=1618668 RepID=A0A0G1YT26_9BACT|nr:MAG: hypothetical protein UY59_C0015G0012 [Candidatus Kaiserbacteria bacterium GW2011_GWA1_50_28]